jgi:hypothetical protein
MLAARTAFLLALAAFGSVVVACSAAPDSSKKPLPVCDAKDPECPGVPASAGTNKTHADVPSDPVKVPDPAPASEPTPQAEAGVDAAPVVGKDCQGLAACCKQLGDAGYDTTKCKSVLSTNNEDACYTQHASYKSFGDCS